jgi:hypothetical protein
MKGENDMSDQKALAVQSQNAVSRHSMADMKTMASVMVASGMFSGVKNEQQAYALMLLCDAENIHPALALRRYHLINGTPAMKAETMLAEFKRLGGKVRWIQRDDHVVSATFHLDGEDSPPITWDDSRVKQAGINNPNHLKFPCQMKTARVISEGIRLMAPGIVQGIYTPEEVSDFQSEPLPPLRVHEPVVMSTVIDTKVEPTLAPAQASPSPFPPTLFERAKKTVMGQRAFAAILQDACADGAVDADAVGELLRRCLARVVEAPASLSAITAIWVPFAPTIHEVCPEYSEQLTQLGCPPAVPASAPVPEGGIPFTRVVPEASAPAQPMTLEAAVTELERQVTAASADKLAVWNKHRLEILKLASQLGSGVTREQTSRIAACRPS